MQFGSLAPFLAFSRLNLSLSGRLFSLSAVYSMPDYRILSLLLVCLESVRGGPVRNVEVKRGTFVT